MDKSGANKAAIHEINADKESPILVRQVSDVQFEPHVTLTDQISTLAR